MDKNEFDAALIPGFREALKEQYHQLRLAGSYYYNVFLNDKKEFIPGTYHKRNCPLCREKHETSTQLYYVHGMHIVECKNCSMVYSVEVLDKSLDKQLYNSEEKAQNAFVNVKRNNLYRELEQKKAQYYLNCIDSFRKIPGTLLDIGCSTGVLLQEAAIRGWKCFGVDTDENACQFIKDTSIEIHHGFFPEVFAEDKHQFDLITLLDVLEHVEDPVWFLTQVNDYLKNNGKVLIQVPNYNSLIIRLEGASNSNYGHGHWSYFSPESLTLAAKKVGLRVLHIETVISEIDKIKAYSMDQIASVIKQITGIDIQQNEISIEFLHRRLMGYKLFIVAEKNY